MSLLEDAQVNSTPLSSTNEEILLREIILTHDPDDHYLDSEQLLHLVDSAFHPTAENVLDAHLDAISTTEFDLTESEKPISFIIYKVSNQILSQCFEDENLHKKTLLLLEILGHYRWDAKVVIALASFAHSFTLFQLISQLQSDNALAVALATFKRLPRAISKLKPRFEAMDLLINTMLKVTKIIVRFEGMSLQHDLVDANVFDITKSKIYSATYWIFRSILLCFLEIADLKRLELDEQVYSEKTVIAVWGLHTVGSKLNCLCHNLGENVDKCQKQIDARFYGKMQNIFKEDQVDNQKALRTFFAAKDDFPLMNASSGEKCGILELKNKVVILLISKPDLMPLDKLFLLVQQTYDCPRRKELEGSYAILWIPISSLCGWTGDDMKTFEFFTNCVPWFSIKRPWLQNSTTVNFIKQEWNFKEEPIMVVLNENGTILNKDAMDMVWIWGLKAFPFSTLREKEIWEQENWIQDYFVSAGLVEEGKDLCIYGSDDIVWIREFAAAMKKIQHSNIQLEMIYVGCRNAGEKVKAIIDSIEQEKLCASLTFRMVELFWFQLERIKRTMDGSSTDTVGAKLAALVKLNVNEKWAVMSKGGWSKRDVVYVDAEKLKECMEVVFPMWSKQVGEAKELVDALEQLVIGGDTESETETCDHSQVVPYDEAGLADKRLICARCKRLVEKYVLYKCEN